MPSELLQVFLEGGGELAIDKAANALDIVEELSRMPRSEKKQVALLISHEEVIGSLAYQVGEYLRENGHADEDTVKAIEAVKFGYNDGFDFHVDANGDAAIDINGIHAGFNIQDIRQYLAEKRTQQL
jgi:hypothetical protein